MSNYDSSIREVEGYKYYVPEEEVKRPQVIKKTKRAKRKVNFAKIWVNIQGRLISSLNNLAGA